MPHRRAPRHLVALAGVSIASLLAACGGHDDGGSAAADRTTTTSGAVAAVKAALAAAPLTPQDLATGDALDAPWVPGDVSKGVDIQLPACVVEAAPTGAVASADSQLVTQNDLKLPSLSEDVAAFQGTGAADAFSEAAQRLDACDPTFVFQGAEAVGAIERLPLTLPGDQSAAWRTTVTIAGAPVSITNIHIQDGEHEVALTHVDLGTPDPGVLEGYATKALSKLG